MEGPVGAVIGYFVGISLENTTFVPYTNRKILYFSNGHILVGGALFVGGDFIGYFFGLLFLKTLPFIHPFSFKITT